MASSRASSSPAESRPPGPNDETRVRLVEATKRCLEKFGIRKTGVIDIVREAGSSRQTAYRYFSGRRELIYNAFLDASGRLLARIPEAVESVSEPLDVLVETLLFLFRELPRDPIMSQAFGPGALATLSPIGSDRAATTDLTRVALASYRDAVGDIDLESFDHLAEHVNRIVLSAMVLPEDDPLLKADDVARAKLRAWFGPVVERHCAQVRRSSATKSVRRRSARHPAE